MGDERTYVGAQAGTQFSTTGRLGRDADFRGGCPDVDGDAKIDRFIALIESRTFLQECILRSMQSAFSVPLVAYATMSELESQLDHASVELVMLSCMGASKEACASALGGLSELVPNVPVIILSSKDDADLARTAISHGAKGYIPCTVGFEIAVAAVRLVLAGGSYAPLDFLGARAQPPRVADPPVGSVTPRELAVVRAIQQGKSNKVIAYELSMCESTVKVHVRNIMKKMSAKNRTEVAMKAQTAVEHRESVAPAPRIGRPHASTSLANSTMRKSSAPHSTAIFSARSSVSASEPAQ